MKIENINSSCYCFFFLSLLLLVIKVLSHVLSSAVCSVSCCLIIDLVTHCSRHIVSVSFRCFEDASPAINQRACCFLKKKKRSWMFPKWGDTSMPPPHRHTCMEVKLDESAHREQTLSIINPQIAHVHCLMGADPHPWVCIFFVSLWMCVNTSWPSTPYYPLMRVWSDLSMTETLLSAHTPWFCTFH